MQESQGKNITLTKLTPVRRLTLTALFFAVALILSLVENLLPPLPIAIPGIKPGLSNIAVMYTLFFLGRSEALGVAVLKAGFAVLTRGVVAGLLSLCGGVLSIAVMAAAMFFLKDKISYFTVSMLGAVFHNVGQFAAISMLYTSMQLWGYLPVLLIAGVAAGAVTSILLKFILPAFKRLG